MSRLALTVRGVVQGVGFRPFVRRAALSQGLVGWVQNGSDGVRIEVQGDEAKLSGFLRAIAHDLPLPGRVDTVEKRAIDEAPDASFAIADSRETTVKSAVLPADLAPCAQCRAEVALPGARRYRYPFTSCARCGPRYAIAFAVPYDRHNTTMAGFAMCEACRAEYEDVGDRRYHAQPIACPRCGPRLSLLAMDGTALAEGDDALCLAAARLREGQIVALRGLGGFQLLALATSDAATERLRARKKRPDKPFAVLFASLEEVLRSARLSQTERDTLAGPEAPILLAARRSDGPLPDAVHRQSPFIGAMLAATPLHQLLVDEAGGPLVCTSGNLHDEPMCLEAAEVFERLGHVADGVLTHDRPIARPLDDSVVRATERGAQVLRRARGYAPLGGLRIAEPRAVLGLGAHLKSAIALAHRGRVIQSQHLGDLVSAAARDRLADAVTDLCAFYDATPEVVVCDSHPDYASTRLAETLAARFEAPLLRVQHHHAHVAAVMAEHDLRGEVLGLSWDGLGLGDDGTLWGGEALLCAGSGYERVAHLGSFRLVGGERAARSPRRVALGLLADVLPERLSRASAWFEERELATCLAMLERGVSSPVCTSVGRLFDAVAALLGEVYECSFEGHAALAVEALATRAPERCGAYPLPLAALGGSAVASLAPLLEALTDDIDRGATPETVARRFHGALIELGVAMAKRAGAPQVALAGGCFANRILSEGLRQRLDEEGFSVFSGSAVPPGDGGIAVGQVWLAASANG